MRRNCFGAERHLRLHANSTRWRRSRVLVSRCVGDGDFFWVRISWGTDQYTTQKNAGDTGLTDNTALASSSTHCEDSGGTLLACVMTWQLSSSSSSLETKWFRKPDCARSLWKLIAKEDSRKKNTSHFFLKILYRFAKDNGDSSRVCQKQLRTQRGSFVQHADVSTQKWKGLGRGWRRSTLVQIAKCETMGWEIFMSYARDKSRFDFCNNGRGGVLCVGAI